MSDNVFAGTDVLDDLYGDTEFTQEDMTPKASRSCDKAGWYHGFVLSMKAESPDHQGVNSVVRLDIQIFTGDHPDQKDAMVFHRVRLFKVLKKDGKPIGREAYGKDYAAQAMRTAAGLGLIPRDGSVKLSQIPWQNAEGAQVVFKIDADKETYDDKTTGEKKEVTRYQVNFGNFFRPDDPEVAKVQKDGEALAMLTGGAGIGEGNISDI